MYAPENAIRDIPPSNLQPSPYHERSFDIEPNQSYICEIRSRGYLKSVLVARETDTGLELVEGHKRRWAAEQAGLDTVAVRVVDFDEWDAAAHYVRDHLPLLDTASAERTRRRLAERWGSRIDELLPEQTT